MIKVNFNCVSQNDSSEYNFTDSKGNSYYLYSDERASFTLGLNPNFWDCFYSCQYIGIEYKVLDNKNIITKIVSYKNM